MEIAITAKNASLNAEVDPRFDRCQYFIFINPETMQYGAVENTSAGASGDAGVPATQMMVGMGVKAVLTGNCGPNTHQVLSAAGIKVFTGTSGKLRDAIEGYKSGELQATSQPTVRGHAGMGRGMGRYTGASVTPGVTPVSRPEDPAAELGSMRAELQRLTEKLVEVQCRLDMLEKK